MNVDTRVRGLSTQVFNVCVWYIQVDRGNDREEVTRPARGNEGGGPGRIGIDIEIICFLSKCDTLRGIEWKKKFLAIVAANSGRSDHFDP